jgi:hypothetical protein
MPTGRRRPSPGALPRLSPLHAQADDSLAGPSMEVPVGEPRVPRWPAPKLSRTQAVSARAGRRSDLPVRRPESSDDTNGRSWRRKSPLTTQRPFAADFKSEDATNRHLRQISAAETPQTAVCGKFQHTSGLRGGVQASSRNWSGRTPRSSESRSPPSHFAPGPARRRA